jgi:hypothetical protein
MRRILSYIIVMSFLASMSTLAFAERDSKTNTRTQQIQNSNDIVD